MAGGRLSTRKLRYFIETARSGSFVAAARALNMSQPALSLQIKQLEDELGVELLSRQSRRITLTPAGEDFLRHAEAAIEAIRRAEASVEKYRTDKSSQTINLGLIPTIGRAIVHELLDKSDQLGIRFALREGLGNELLNIVRKGELQATFCYDPQPSDGYTVHPLVREYPVLVCRKGLGDSNAKPIAITDLPRFPLLIGGTTNASRMVLERLAADYALRLDIRYEVPATSLHREILLKEDVYSFVPQGHYLADLEAGTLEKHALDPPVEQMLALVVSNRLEAVVQSAVLGLIKAAIARQIGQGKQGWMLYGALESAGVHPRLG
ncbi:LysR family transcriptional regulator [Roseiarcaceae bacterium H3SJ34-1]|uniref:LysR family transcriptional regulator n=1 Tax=Terripilifer ovatus TaxID=3032367 RepID=UPI003AB97DE1|nr:LysR family transcriptional regulator [Roseiarcaceae bacterium H3SJ34-1]